MIHPIMYLPAFLATNLGVISTGTPTDIVSKLNKILTDCGVAVGGVIIVIAVIKFILSLSEENVAENQKASLLFGIGIIFISVTKVLELLGVTSLGSTTTPNVVAKNVITVLSSITAWAGAMLLLLGILRHVMALAQENADESAKASKCLITGLGLLQASLLGRTISTSVIANTQEPSTYMDHITKWLAGLMMFSSIYYVITGIFKICEGLKQEDPKERQVGSRFLLTAVALLSIKAILSKFGFAV